MATQSESIITVGFDPDLEHSAVAVLKDGVPFRLWAGEARSRTLSEACNQLIDTKLLLPFEGTRYSSVLVLELPQHYIGGRANPMSLTVLSALCGAMCAAWPSGSQTTHFIHPTAWTRGLKKEIRQNQLLNLLGWGRLGNIQAPEQFCFSNTEWKHLLDAIGIASWAYDRLKMGFRIESVA